MKKRQKANQFPVLLLLPLSFSLALSKIGFVIAIMVLAASTGDLLLTAGMKQVGEVSTLQLRSLLRLARRALTNPLITLGVFCMAADFFLFIALLSWVDLSLVMPMTALSYSISIFGCHYFLKETVTTARLFGTGLIGVGVALISWNASTS